jgi:hypothetical protein
LAGTAVVAVLATVAVIVIPTGPDVSEDALKASVLDSLQVIALPHSGDSADGVKSFTCTHGFFSTKSWDCKLVQDIAGSIARVEYDVSVKSNRCWTARKASLSDRNSPDDPGYFLPDDGKGCVDQ